MLSLPFQRLYPVDNGLDLTSVFMRVRVCVCMCGREEGVKFNILYHNNCINGHVDKTYGER